MASDPDSLALSELSDLGKVSIRTIRFYIQQGLLPAPESRGPGAHYGPEHLDRLLLIRRMQREHLPLAEIRRRLQELGPVEVKRLLEREPVAESSAAEYIRATLGSTSVRESQPAYSRPDFARTAPSAPSAPSKPPHRSMWDRVSLSPDVELHVRRPLSRDQNRQVERLIEAARNVFEDFES